MIDNKTDCVDCLVRSLERSSVWRRSLSAKFPDDPRNQRAAETLDTLAVQAARMTDEQFALLQPHFSWASPSWRAAVSTSCRQVGFHNRSKEFDSFARALVHELSLPSRIAA